MCAICYVFPLPLPPAYPGPPTPNPDILFEPPAAHLLGELRLVQFASTTVTSNNAGLNPLNGVSRRFFARVCESVCVCARADVCLFACMSFLCVRMFVSQSVARILFPQAYPQQGAQGTSVRTLSSTVILTHRVQAYVHSAAL